MSKLERCPRCGSELSSVDAQGLCPSCLLLVGMESNTATGVPQRGSGNSPAEKPTKAFQSDQPTRIVADLPQPGDKLGNYRLIRKLGKGGMGMVFEAEDLENGRVVALKLLAHSLESPEARNRFFREGRLAASINHPNSVYVFGTEEIDGTPAISMEYVLGGNLHDRVRQQGPLAVTEAVDAILQIIDGLEAAAAVGVLHRDVKPSNCFVDVDGTVKVGDFGLSISTSVRSDSHLTTPGSFMGTPAFSSPEQLRGDELDVRSDIYATGVTLFYLLTGRTPYEAENLVKLLATVLEQPAPSPSKFRKEIPRGLASAILRCLAKQPAERFKNYAELRKVLLAYNSTAPTPATLARRFAAGLCDQLLFMVSVMTIQLAVLRGDLSLITDPALFRSPGFIAWMTVALILYGLYFAIPEGLWGASLGKAICRLRVVDRSRNRIGIPSALGRTAIFIVFPNLILWIYTIFAGRFPFDVERMGDSTWISMLVSYSYYVMLALLFSTARRNNGYSGLHDLAVGSRVILRAAYHLRPKLEIEEDQLPDVDETETVGLYRLLDTLGSDDASQFLLGYDLRLLRRVWIHKVPIGTPVVGAERRNIGRVGRLRWINGRREGVENWDVYEALSGKPLVNLIDQPRPWSVVRYWLLDLARELEAAEKDGSMPPKLCLDRVWITAAGRAKLLDFPAPGTTVTSKNKELPIPDQCSQTPAAYLLRVATAAIQDGPNVEPLPVEARELLNRLSVAENLDGVCEDLKRLVNTTPTVTRLRRLAMLSATIGFPLLMSLVGMAGMYAVSQWNQQHPEISELRNCLMFLDRSANVQITNGTEARQRPSSEVEREALEIYIAGKFRPIIADRKIWYGFMGLTIPQPHRNLAEQIMADRPAPTVADLTDAEATIEPILKQVAEMNEAMQQISPLTVGSIQFVGIWFIFVALGGLIATLAFRRGLIMMAFGVDCVTRSGVMASRPRMLWRWFVFNTPVLSAPFLLVLLSMFFLSPTKTALTPLLLFIASALVVITVWSLLLPVRGLTDRLSGTFSVPR